MKYSVLDRASIMKETVSQEEAEKLTKLEGGLCLKNGSKDFNRGINRNLYTRVLKCMQVILYIHLILFVGWASYALWQTYRMQEASTKDLDGIPDCISQKSEGISDVDKYPEPETSENDMNQTNILLEEDSEQSDKQHKLTIEEKNRQYEDELINDLLLGTGTKEIPAKENLSLGDAMRDVLTRYASSSSINDQSTSRKSSEVDSDISLETSEIVEEVSEVEDIEDLRVNKEMFEETSEDSLDLYDESDDYWSDSNYQDTEEFKTTTDDTPVDSYTPPMLASLEIFDDPADRISLICFKWGAPVCKVYRYESGKIDFCEPVIVQPHIYLLKCKNLKNAAEEIAVALPNSVRIKTKVKIMDEITNEIQSCRAYYYSTGVCVVSCGETRVDTVDLLNAKAFESEEEENSKESKDNNSESDEVVHQVWQIFRRSQLIPGIQKCLTNSRKAVDMDKVYNCQSPDKPLDIRRIGDPSWETVKITPLPYIISQSEWPTEIRICPLYPMHSNPYEMHDITEIMWSLCRPVQSYSPKEQLNEKSFETARDFRGSDYDTHWESKMIHKKVYPEKTTTTEGQIFDAVTAAPTTRITPIVRRLARYTFNPDVHSGTFEECDVWFVDGEITNIVECSPVSPMNRRAGYVGKLIVRIANTSETRTCLAGVSAGVLSGFECGPLNPTSKMIDQWINKIPPWVRLDYFDVRIHGTFDDTNVHASFHTSLSKESEESEESAISSEDIPTTKGSVAEDNSPFAYESFTWYRPKEITEKQVFEDQMESNNTSYDDDFDANNVTTEMMPSTSTENDSEVIETFVEEIPTTKGSVPEDKSHNLYESTTWYKPEETTEKRVFDDQMEINSTNYDDDSDKNSLKTDELSQPKCLVRFSLNWEKPDVYGHMEACRVRYDNLPADEMPTFSDCHEIPVPIHLEKKICHGNLLVYDQSSDDMLVCEVDLIYTILRIGLCKNWFDYNLKYMDMDECSDSKLTIGAQTVYYIDTIHARIAGVKRDKVTGAVNWCAAYDNPVLARRRREVSKEIETDNEDVSNRVLKEKIPDFIVKHITKSKKQEQVKEEDLQKRKQEQLYRQLMYRRNRSYGFFPSRRCRQHWPFLSCTHPWRFRRSIIKLPPPPQRKISNDITDTQSSKEEFYNNVRAKAACLQQNGDENSVDCRRYRKWQNSKKPTSL